MAIRLARLLRNQAIADSTGAATTLPAFGLRDISGGVEAAVAPDIVILVPKAAGAGASALLTALGTGTHDAQHSGAAGAVAHDILALRLHAIQRVATGAVHKYCHLVGNTNIATAGGTNINPALLRAGVAQAPSIVIPTPKALSVLATTRTYVPTVMATGNINLRHAEAGNIAHDILFIDIFTAQAIVAALYGVFNDRLRTFTILDVGPDATYGAVYTDAADITRQYRVMRTKVTGDGSTQLLAEQIAGTSVSSGAGNLNLVTGTGDAVVAFTGCIFDKLVDLQLNTNVANGAGLVFDPGLQVNGVRVMPDIVIPVPKASPCVPYVPTDLTGAVGSVTIQHAAVAPVACDILSLRLFSVFRDNNIRSFTILDAGPDAAVGAIYRNFLIPSQTFRVLTAKVSGDGATALAVEQLSGIGLPAAPGTLALNSGTGDSLIAFSGVANDI
jgi:hypothetical protein